MWKRTAMVAGVLAAAIFTMAQGPRVATDQSSPAAVAPIPFTHAVGGASEQVVSQTVTVGVTGRLISVQVPIACAGGRLTLEIRDVNAAGQPGDTVLRNITYPVGVPGGGDVTADLRTLRISGPPLNFSAGDRFAISLSNRTGSCGVWPGPIGNPYAGGSGWADANDGPVVELSLGNGRDDMPFATVVRR
jgi:hypothetical protein